MNLKKKNGKKKYSPFVNFSLFCLYCPVILFFFLHTFFLFSLCCIRFQLLQFVCLLLLLWLCCNYFNTLLTRHHNNCKERQKKNEKIVKPIHIVSFLACSCFLLNIIPLFIYFFCCLSLVHCCCLSLSIKRVRDVREAKVL